MADMKENEEGQEKQTMIRQKENSAYNAETTEMKEALGALEKGLLMLGNSGSAALLQKSSGSMQNVVRTVEAVAATAPEKVPADKISLLKAFAANMAADGEASTKYEPQSASISGILKEMYKVFSKDLESKSEAEATAQRNFEDLMVTKREEMANMQASMKKKEGSKAEAETQLAEATQEYDDTESQMKADVKLFDQTKENCMDKADEYKERFDLRTEEMKGIKKAIEILSSDEARSLFGKSIQEGIGTGTFLQVESSTSAMPALVKKAYIALREQASRTKSLRIARLATSCREASADGEFDEVIKAIQNMIETLNDEAKEDVEKRDQCKEEYHDFDMKTADLEWKISKNDAKIRKLDAIIKKQTAEEAHTVDSIKDVTKQIEELKDERTADKQEYEAAKKDDENALDILGEAKDALSSYYEKNDVSLELAVKKQSIEKKELVLSEHRDAPDAEFSDKGDAAGQAKSIIALMQHIIEDVESEIEEADKAEKKAIEEYKKTLEAAEQLKSDLETKKTNIEDALAKSKEERTAEMEDLEENKGDHKDEVDYKKEIAPDCDWIIANLEKRRKARDAEIDGLTKAKDYLSGMSDSLVQTVSKSRSHLRSTSWRHRVQWQPPYPGK
eukprot:gnl/TRDRNA2_/TRDRNA2_139489_c1_seq1.p1 gnl/TRDRNA2_/TRDRNA2_139489_c1~~gnl/TRDRNA2_/TRDRNA2_139489_c1_seq1.p1  ORF type:complete len:621 (-),score=247.09 gnl/TRDRNA2_/TRDRNA2_139489_c1_seq1:31-1893(-)